MILSQPWSELSEKLLRTCSLKTPSLCTPKKGQSGRALPLTKWQTCPWEWESHGLGNWTWKLSHHKWFLRRIAGIVWSWMPI